MKTKIIITLTLILAFSFNMKAQDLTSISSSTWTWPEFTFDPNTNELDIQMTIKNVGWADAELYSVEFVLTDVNSSWEYQIDYFTYSGLSYQVQNNMNIEQITGLTYDLDNQSLPSGQYRLEARINDDQTAYETDYNNNIENFGQNSFNYNSSSASIFDEQLNPSFNVFPNPIGNQKIQIKSTGSIGAFFTLLNLQGELIFKEELKGEETTLYLPELETGIYIYQIQGENGSLLETARICQN